MVKITECARDFNNSVVAYCGVLVVELSPSFSSLNDVQYTLQVPNTVRGPLARSIFHTKPHPGET
jgi:hypothetical protein